MKQFLLILSMICSMSCLFAQKPTLDSSVYTKWPCIEDPCLSNDGKYAAYAISYSSSIGSYSVSGGFPITTKKGIIRSTETNWSMEFSDFSGPMIFTSDNKHAIFLSSASVLNLINLKTKVTQKIHGVSSFTIPDSGSGEWLSYEQNSKEQKTVLRSLTTGVNRSFLGTCLGFLSIGKKVIAVHKKIDKGNPEQQNLEWSDLSNGKTCTIWKGKEINNIIFDAKNNQFAFKDEDSILYYKFGMSEAICIWNMGQLKMNEGLKVGSLNTFSKGGDRLFLNLEEKEHPNQDLPLNMLEIWNYQDLELQSQQVNNLNIPKSYEAVLRLSDHELIQLNKYEDEFVDKRYDSVYLSTHKSSRNGSSWSIGSELTCELVNSRNGQRKIIPLFGRNPQLSPTGRFVIAYDPVDKNYFSYNIASGKINKITHNLPVSWNQLAIDDNVMSQQRGIAAWLPSDEAVFIYNDHDIWQLDPTGKNEAINFTNGYGVRHNLVFNLALSEDNLAILPKKGKVFLNGFDLKNKNNGFFEKKIGRNDDPVLLTMGAYIYNTHSSYFTGNFTPLKAKQADVYLVRRNSATEAPNFFATKNFMSFKRLSNLCPEKDYNWYITELHNWTSLDGKKLQGILYKPESFDPSKKYPVIFHYYERKTDGLNAYLIPDYSQGPLDISSYVSKGYLVFCPDIYYKVGDPMQGTYDAVISAAKYLAGLPFVNSLKMGLQGHSFGGVQTNYLVTHSNLFAAACSASGISDWISGYGTISGANGMGMYETAQLRMGTTLWANLPGYIKNSAIFQANKVTTPLLMMHTKNDEACPYPNAMEFFLGLRRLGKKAWMLVYPEGRHALVGNESKDFTLRMEQFFNHYLKDAPAPVWMTKGIDASKRGIDNGFEYDSEISTPGPGLLTAEEQLKADSLMVSKPKTITLK